ncbi:MAG: hypothetical protein COZ09_02980 [Comamonadaceae bacterium CG_4_10_14_3_um_filter_60_42]|nr:MAG: hypothetical protein COZ09_02980 [Comamonadaceae bacterium CG_4_10_14_3_um_filter_60_42]
MVKLLDYADQDQNLEANPNPFALVTAAHLRTRQTKHNPEQRYQATRTLVRLLYTHGWSRQRVLDLFSVLDWMMRLPDGLAQQLWRDIKQIEGETRMKYVTSVERLAIERGMQQGEARGHAEGEAEGEAAVLTRSFNPPAQQTLWPPEPGDSPTPAKRHP